MLEYRERKSYVAEARGAAKTEETRQGKEEKQIHKLIMKALQ